MLLNVGRTVWFPCRISGNSWRKPVTRTPRLWSGHVRAELSSHSYMYLRRHVEAANFIWKFCGRNKAIRIFYLHEPIKSIQEICGKILSEEERTALFRYDFGSPRLDSDISFTILLTSYFCWKENPANRFYLIYCLEL